jgi:hypothetical protein
MRVNDTPAADRGGKSTAGGRMVELARRDRRQRRNIAQKRSSLEWLRHI